jgi:hypothetical protein
LSLRANGSFSYTPASNYSGPDGFTYSVSEGDVATVSIAVNRVNDAPIAVQDTATATKNSMTPIEISVLANDSDADGDSLTVQLIGPAPSNPRNAGIVMSNGTTVTYTPKNGFAGAATFIYRVYDGHAYSNDATITITVERK